MADLNGYTCVVTGFPRSGTSMMMRMLGFGGIEIIADKVLLEPQHKHDPYGCWELTEVGVRIQNNSREWTANRAVKIVTPYIHWIPLDRPIKAIFMQRDIQEIITSLLAMRTIWGIDIEASIATARQILKDQGISVLGLKYHEVMKYPKTAAVMIEDFLETSLDKGAMLKAVDRDARNRYSREPGIVGSDKPDGIIRTDSDSYQDIKLEVYGKPG